MATDEITLLIDAITGGGAGASVGPRPLPATPSLPPAGARPPQGRGARGSAVVGFGLVLAIAGLVAVGLREPPPVAPPVARATAVARAEPVEIVQPVEPVVRENRIARAEPVVAAPPVEPVVPIIRVVRAVAPPKPRIFVAKAEPVVVPPRIAPREPENRKAVHLTGVALEVALAEDRIKTRVLNQRQLDRLGDVSSR